MKNKKGTIQFLLIALFFASILFGVSAFSHLVFAEQGLGVDAGSKAAAVAGVENGDSLPDADNYVVTAFKYLLYWLLIILVQFVQVGASVFAWATRPEYISGPTGLLNLDSVYTLWAFIRDFFNLFFIFLLLFSAFATVFQIEQYGIKKNFFKIIIAAIAINFSFPFTRIIIDLGNVPMYFFADGIVSAGATKENALLSIPNALFSSTGMGSIVAIPQPSETGTLVPLLTAVIFTFIFMVTLVTLALLFVIRLLKLVILLILSPVGVAASIVPGLKSLGTKWSSLLFDTVFFGPSAMFMIVLALRFSAEIQKSGFAQGLSGTAPAASPDSQSSIIAQGVFFIPIIMMWMAMSIGNRASDGASKAIMKKGTAALAWGKKAALGSAAYATYKNPMAKGAIAGTKERAYEGRLFGDKVKKITGGRLGAKAWKESAEATEARAKGFASGGVTGRDKEIDKLRDKRARATEKKWKDDGKTVSEIAKILEDKKNKDKDDNIIANADTLAATRFLSNEKEGIKDKDLLASALSVANASKDKDLYDKVLNASNDDALDMSAKQLNEVREGYKKAHYKASTKKEGEAESVYEERIKKEEKDFDDSLDGKFRSKFKKEGKLKVFIDYKIGELKAKGSPLSMEDLKKQVFKNEKVFSMNAKDIAKNKSLLSDADFQSHARLNWNSKQINGVEKFLIEDGGDEEAIKIAESIRKSVESRERRTA